MVAVIAVSVGVGALSVVCAGAVTVWLRRRRAARRGAHRSSVTSVDSSEHRRRSSSSLPSVRGVFPAQDPVGTRRSTRLGSKVVGAQHSSSRAVTKAGTGDGDTTNTVARCSASGVDPVFGSDGRSRGRSQPAPASSGWSHGVSGPSDGGLQSSAQGRTVVQKRPSVDVRTAAGVGAAASNRSGKDPRDVPVSRVLPWGSESVAGSRFVKVQPAGTATVCGSDGTLMIEL